MAEDLAKPIILYDGVCGLCNRLVQFLLKRDKNDRFRFASLQSDSAGELLKRHGLNPADLDTVYVVVSYGKTGERLLSRSDAVVHALRELGGPWKVAGLARMLPRFIRDAAYGIVARNRYRVFGKYEVCMMPEERFKYKFLG